MGIMGKHRIKKWKQILTGILTAALVMGMGKTPFWYAGEDGEPETACLSLPVLEGCGYDLAGVEYLEKTEERGEIRLTCRPGTDMSLIITGDWALENVRLEYGEREVFQTFEGRQLDFEMPHEDLWLRADVVKEDEEQKGEDQGSEPGEEESQEIQTGGSEGDQVGEMPGDPESETEETETEEGSQEEETSPESESGAGETSTEPESGTGETFPEPESGAGETSTEPGKQEEQPPADEIGESQKEELIQGEEIPEDDGYTENGDGAGGKKPENTALMELETEEETEEIVQEESKMQENHLLLAAAPGSVTLHSGDFYYAPSGLRSGPACTVYKTVTFKSGGEQVTKVAFCLQPYASGPDDGHVYQKDDVIELGDGTAKNRNIMKALYYLYSGPAWGKKADYSDGSGSVSLKEVMESAGCTGMEHYYCISHYVISYFYLGANGNWNSSRMEEGTVNNVFNDKGIQLITRLAEEIKKLPVPDASLSALEVTATHDLQKRVYRSQSLVYQAPAGNTGTISLPQGITLVNETTGENKTGKASLEGGDRFYLQAQAGSRTGTENFAITTDLAVDFAAYRLEFAGRQDVGFACESGGTQLSFSVEWPQGGTLTLEKVDAETGTSLSYNGHYTLAGAVYGVYTDSGCAQEAARLTVGGDGKAQIFLTQNTYYLKEIQAPKGYEKDEQVHRVSVGDEGGSCKIRENPVLERIKIRKKDSQTGQEAPQNSQCSFAGAEYTIYRDAGCTDPVQVMVTDGSGAAVSGELRLGTYYVKETKAPQGYLPDMTVYPVTLTQEDSIEVYEISSAEQIIRGSLALVKYLDDSMEESVLQDLYDSGKLEHIRFTLRHEDPNVAPVTIETDRYGYAATKRQELVYGTWYLTEDKTTTPEGYEGIENAKIEIKEEGTEQIYVVTNKPYQAYLCIRKLDAVTGNVITSSEAEFQILDSEGKTVQMPTFDGYTDTFRTNEKGEIRLTRSLKGGRYTLVETKAPEGYQKAEPLPFQISQNAVFDEPLTLVCRDQPQLGRIELIKTDKDTKEHCGEGFVFQIMAGEDIVDGSGALRTMEVDGQETELRAGTVVDTVTTDGEGTARSRDLYLGAYEVQEIRTGEFYAVSPESHQVKLEPGAEEATVVCALQVENEQTALEIVKLDGDTETPLAGVNFCLWEKEGQEKEDQDTEDQENENGGGSEQTDLEQGGEQDGSEESGAPEDAGPEETDQAPAQGDIRTSVTDENGRVRFDRLKQDTIYCLQETATLPGYVLDPQIYEIQVDELGRIQGQAVWEMRLSNVPNLLQVSKQDITGSGELPGAELILENEAGEELERWISGEEPHLIRGLTAGKYRLTEITAPQGYAVAESIEFELTDSFEIQQITMYDKPLEPETEPETEPQTQPEPEPQTEPQTDTEPETEPETEPKTETETEAQTQKESETEPAALEQSPGGGPKTGDDTPLWGMAFVALCALVLIIGELLRRLLRIR